MEEDKITIDDWSELALLEDLLCDFVNKNGRKNHFHDTARKLLERIRPVLANKTTEI